MTLSRYTPAATPVLPFGGAPPPSQGGNAAPFSQPQPAFGPNPPPAAAPPAWQPPAAAAPPSSSPWSTRAPMPRGLTQQPAQGGAPAAAPQSSLLAASNAAADPGVSWGAPRAVASPGRAVPAPEPAVSPAGQVTQLLWFDEAAVSRVRRVAAYKPLLDALDAGPPDRSLEDPANDLDPMLVEDRRAIFEIAARGAATDARGVGEALTRAVRADGLFVAPIVLVAGELGVPFDELAELEATIAIATPLATPDASELLAALEVGQKFLQVRGQASARSMARSLASRIREAFAKEKKLTLSQLDEHVQRSLLESRSFQRREVLGEPHLRLLLHAGDQGAGEAPLVVYAPEAVAKKLPMYARFSARLIAEVELQEDESETSPRALRLLALVRRTPVPPAT